MTERQKYKTRTFHGGKRAAEVELARFVTQVSDGRHGPGDTTLADLTQRWHDYLRVTASAPSTKAAISDAPSPPRRMSNWACVEVAAASKA